MLTNILHSLLVVNPFPKLTHTDSLISEVCFFLLKIKPEKLFLLSLIGLSNWLIEMYFAQHLPLTTGLQRDAISMQRVQLGMLMSAPLLANNPFCNLIIFLLLCIITLWSLFCLHRLRGTFCTWEALQTICLPPTNLHFPERWSQLWTTDSSHLLLL